MGDSHDHDHPDADCEEALVALYTFLDGELTEARRVEIRHHLDDCSPCLEVFDFEAELRMVIRQRCQDQVPESLRRRVADRLAAAVEAEPGTVRPADPVAGAGPPVPGRRPTD
jgi:mycothiol system anti-sigma-R factor